jgi:hypothetical protein
MCCTSTQPRPARTSQWRIAHPFPSARRVNQWGSVFRDSKPGQIRERELVPFTFDDDEMNSSSSDAKQRAPTPTGDVKLPLSPRKRDRKLRKSAKETDAKQGGFLTAMGSKEGEKISSSSNKKKKYERTGDWGPVPHPSERPTWGRFMHDEDEKRVAEEWRDTGRRTE